MNRSTFSLLAVAWGAALVLGGERQENMQRYDRKSRTQEAVSSGQAGALQTAAHRTRGTSLLIPSLLYTQAGLSGTITQIEGAQVTGTDTINGRACHKITGTAVMILSGRRNNERAVTVWIDAESRLIRRVFEDTKGLPGNTFSRLTVTLDPRANPTIEDARFQFKVPSP